MTVATKTHVEVDAAGVARIAGSNLKVKLLAFEHARLGMSVAEIREAHDHLTIGQIHGALAFYYDNQATIDEQIEEDERTLQRFDSTNSEHPLIERLKREGRVG